MLSLNYFIYHFLPSCYVHWMRELKYSWPSVPVIEWAKTFRKGLGMTLHPVVGKRNQAFAGLDLILRKWLRIWRWKAIWMKAVPTQVFVIVNKEKEIPQRQFSKNSRKQWEFLDGAPKGNIVQMGKRFLKGGNIKCQGENCPFVICYHVPYSTKSILITMTLLVI